MRARSRVDRRGRGIFVSQARGHGLICGCLLRCFVVTFLVMCHLVEIAFKYPLLFSPVVISSFHLCDLGSNPGNGTLHFLHFFTAQLQLSLLFSHCIGRRELF
jgi:hypothetical protein